jgi:hypothetical protein
MAIPADAPGERALDLFDLALSLERELVGSVGLEGGAVDVEVDEREPALMPIVGPIEVAAAGGDAPGSEVVEVAAGAEELEEADVMTAVFVV